MLKADGNVVSDIGTPLKQISFQQLVLSVARNKCVCLYRNKYKFIGDFLKSSQNKIRNVCTLEYTKIPKVFFTPHHGR
jgi:hypothetical protein